MSVFASLLFAQVIVGATPPVVPLDLETPEVLAARLGAIQATAGLNATGGYYCVLSETSGMGWVDERVCQVASRCSRRYLTDYGNLSSCNERGRKKIVKTYRQALRGEA